MDKKLFKDSIQDAEYTPFLDGIDIMDPPAIIKQVKMEARKFGDNMKHKHRFQAVINARTILGYMEEPKHGYSWTN